MMQLWLGLGLAVTLDWILAASWRSTVEAISWHMSTCHIMIYVVMAYADTRVTDSDDIEAHGESQPSMQ